MGHQDSWQCSVVSFFVFVFPRVQQSERTDVSEKTESLIFSATFFLTCQPLKFFHAKIENQSFRLMG